MSLVSGRPCRWIAARRARPDLGAAAIIRSFAAQTSSISTLDLTGKRVFGFARHVIKLRDSAGCQDVTSRTSMRPEILARVCLLMRSQMPSIGRYDGQPATHVRVHVCTCVCKRACTRVGRQWRDEGALVEGSPGGIKLRLGGAGQRALVPLGQPVAAGDRRRGWRRAGAPAGATAPLAVALLCAALGAGQGPPWSITPAAAAAAEVRSRSVRGRGGARGGRLDGGAAAAAPGAVRAGDMRDKAAEDARVSGISAGGAYGRSTTAAVIICGAARRLNYVHLNGRMRRCDFMIRQLICRTLGAPDARQKRRQGRGAGGRAGRQRCSSCWLLWSQQAAESNMDDRSIHDQEIHSMPTVHPDHRRA